MGHSQSHFEDDTEWLNDVNDVSDRTVTTNFDTSRDNFKVTYLYYDTGNETVSVKRLDCSKILTRRRCAIYLHYVFPYRLFSTEEVERCYQIFQLLACKSNALNVISDTANEIHYGDCYPFPGLKINLIEKVIEFMYQSRVLCIHCYDTRDEVEQRHGNPHRPVFSLKGLLQNNEAFEVFKTFWENIPDHQDVRDILRWHFPEEVIDMICTAIIV